MYLKSIYVVEHQILYIACIVRVYYATFRSGSVIFGKLRVLPLATISSLLIKITMSKEQELLADIKSKDGI